MTINFPSNPQENDTYSLEDTTWIYDGVAWNLVFADSEAITQFSTFAADTGSVAATDIRDTITINGGTNVTTSISGKVLTIDASLEAQSGAGDVFKNITSDDGQAVASGDNDTLSILGGTNISTAIATDTKNLEINLNSFPLGFLSNVSSAAPAAGQVLKWDGSQWAPGTDIAEGGAGLDADTLDGFEGTYYLDYNNFTNTPSVVTLTSFSIGNEPTASGDGAISYDDTTGVFRYTPPDLSSYLTSVAFGDLTNTPTTLAGYGITDAPSELTDLGISDGNNGQFLTTDGAGNFSFATVTADSGASTFVELNDTPSALGTSGQVVAVNSNGSALEFVSIASGDANQNAFSNIAVNGETTVQADTATDTLTIAAGTGISITTDADTDTVTITNTASSSGATAFTGLSDASTANLTIDKIYLPAITMLRVTSSGASAYLFDQYGTTNNPDIYAINGTTIAFNLNVSGHPFLIQDGTGSNYSVGLVHVATNGTVSTGTNAQGKESGTLYWKIPFGISGGYRYQCSLHSVMVGLITVKNFVSI
jgi:plastocyanin